MMRSLPIRRALAAVLAVLASLALVACSGSGAGSGSDSAAVEPARDGALNMPADDTGDSGGGEEESGAMVIRTKTMRLEVSSTADAVDRVREITRSHEGTVSSMQVASGDEWIYHYDETGNIVGDGTAVRGWVTVRVPTDSYEDFVAEVGDLGTIRYQSESTDDVTQEHVDMSARLANLKAQETRLREFFDAAKDVDDMLAIEEELGRVRGEIESLDAQITYLERQAAMATVSVELVEPDDIVTPAGESWGFADAITSGIRGAAAVLTGALTVIIASAPVWLAGLVVFLVVRAVRRRRRAAPPAPESPEEESPEAESPEEEPPHSS